MIRPGTLCYIVAPHPHASEFCVVLSGPSREVHWDTNTPVGFMTVYRIAKQDGRYRCADGRSWAAQPHELIPITPPGITTDERDRIPEAA